MNWISVNERLPKRGIEVLVLGKDKTISVKYLPKRSKEGNYAGDDGKSWYPGGWGVGWTTHWMLLPKKPV